METVFIGILLATALGSNTLLGIWRSGLQRFSPSWFVAIHASIPFLLGFRLLFVPTLWVIPPEVLLAIAGQLIGARLLFHWRPALGLSPVEIENA